MLQSFKIGEYIFDRIQSITGYDSYPCIANNDVKFPYIVYNRTGLSTELTKDGYTQDNVSFEISIYSDKYEESIDVADAVRSALEVLSAQHDETFDVDNSVITNASEYWNDNTYVQQINWTADIVRYKDESGLYIDPSELNVLLEVSRNSGPSETKIVEYTDEMPEQHVYNIKVGESVVFPVLNRVYFEHGLKQKTVEYPEAYFRNNKVEVTWTSSDTNIVEVTEDGLLCKAMGEATLQANYQDRYYVDVPVNVSNESKYIIDLKRPDDNNDFRVRRYKTYTEDVYGIQITPFTEGGIDYVRVTGIAPTAHAQNVEWSYYDDILPGWVTGQDMFKVFNVEAPLEIFYDDWAFTYSCQAFGNNNNRSVVQPYWNATYDPRYDSQIWLPTHTLSNRACIGINRMHTDNDTTNTIPGLTYSTYELNSYSRTSWLLGYAKGDLYGIDISKVTSVKMVIELFVSNNIPDEQINYIDSILYNGKDIVPYIVEKYGTSWKDLLINGKTEQKTLNYYINRSLNEADFGTVKYAVYEITIPGNADWVINTIGNIGVYPNYRIQLGTYHFGMTCNFKFYKE